MKPLQTGGKLTRYPVCDACEFRAAYPVMTAGGVIRLCGGCTADLRLKGERATFIHGKVAA